MERVYLKELEPFFPILESCLFAPIEDLLQRPSKSIRANLVGIGFQIVQETKGIAADKSQVEIAKKILEYLHVGSLIIDDIEDQSTTRRGLPSVHEKYGVGKSLNAGNWLYFLPTQFFKHLNLSPLAELRLHQSYNQTLHLAHIGQSIDLGVKIESVNRAEMARICGKAIELKSGVLAGFALEISSILTEGAESLSPLFTAFGRELGSSLQRFDDLGNFLGKLDDIRNHRPSAVWGYFSEHLSDPEFDSFLSAVQTFQVEAWRDSHFSNIKAMHESFTCQLEAAVRDFMKTVGLTENSDSLKQIYLLRETLKNAYTFL